MSDYLSNLVTRYLGKEAAIQPRLAARFEPPRAANSLAAVHPFDLEETTEAEQSARALAPGALPLASRPTVSQPPVDRPQLTPGTLPQQSNDKRPAADQRLTPIDEPARQPMLPVSLPARKPYLPVSVEPSLTRMAHLQTRQAVIQSSASEAGDQGASHPSTAQELPRKRAAAHSRQVEPSAKPIQAQPVPLPAAQPSLVRESAAPVRPRTTKIIAQPQTGVPAQVEPPKTPEPTIQVTIGRVEVRATPPAEPAPKQRSSASVMSLDDYMKRRNGRGG